MLDECVTLNPRNAFIIPQTVPNSPINGAELAVVARNEQFFSNLVISTLVARFIARDTFSTPPNSVVRFSPADDSFFERETLTSSSYPERKTWPTGLALSSRLASWIDERLRRSQKISMNFSDSFFARRICRYFCAIMPQLTTEKRINK